MHSLNLNKIINTVNSLQATTSREQPPPVSNHFAKNRFVSQSNTVQKLSRKRPLFKFLKRPRPLFRSQNNLTYSNVTVLCFW